VQHVGAERSDQGGDGGVEALVVPRGLVAVCVLVAVNQPVHRELTAFEGLALLAA
jgi:hypothetical protein